MRVLLALHDIQDLGGIINYVEHLCHGLLANGHVPTLVKLENKKAVRSRSSSKVFSKGHSGIPYNQRQGWAFPKAQRIPLASTNWHQYTKNYDVIIWVVPVPSKQKLWDGWEDLYEDTLCKQIMVIHDGNLNKLYPHAYDVMYHMDAVVGVHDCAFNSIKKEWPSEFKRYLIPNPQIKRFKAINFKVREKSVFSLQTFKRWKRVDDLVRAVPFINGKVRLAGGGIEYYYMTSPDKTKPEYKGIWEKALKTGMSYLGYLPESLRDGYLSTSKLLIDPSWSKSYAEYGSHFNRTFVDAIIAGCMPVGRDLLMDGNSYFSKDLYVTIPYNTTSEEFGAVVNEALNMGKKKYTDRVIEMQEVVNEHFDSVSVAAQYMELV